MTDARIMLDNFASKIELYKYNGPKTMYTQLAMLQVIDVLAAETKAREAAEADQRAAEQRHLDENKLRHAAEAERDALLDDLSIGLSIQTTTLKRCEELRVERDALQAVVDEMEGECSRRIERAVRLCKDGDPPGPQSPPRPLINQEVS